MIPLRVLGDRVLIKPDTLSNAPEQLASGIVIAKSLAAAVTGEDPIQHWCRGTVIAVGNPKHPLKEEAEYWADWLKECRDPDCELPRCRASRMMRNLVARAPICAIGDDVLYSHDAGQEVTLADETYLILKEDELLAIVEPEAVPA